MFPLPGDTKKHLLPIFIDPEEVANEDIEEDNAEAKDFTDRATVGAATSLPDKDFWMPDKLCKVCYGCEDAFTMYRRRHHCRMCGQVFCNPCSSFYIDGALINMQGPVRSCRLCHDQLSERTERENKQSRRRMLDWSGEGPPGTSESARNSAVGTASTAASGTGNASTAPAVIPCGMQESAAQKMYHTNNLQNRASAHLEAIVERLVKTASIENPDLWQAIIVNLVREVVSSVDPNVRRGDSLDIRPYVKLKIIPGGTMEESTYIDGVVFRKNVSHKKMTINNSKLNPRILLLTGGIEFQRTDTRLSSMDTLIEQEDKYMEILVEKIMSLKPDLILVGKAVARRAQELLCGHNVVVMQNVKHQLLERIGRMTGAMMLPSTDHMIQQYGEECLGTCGRFWLRQVQDDPERLQQLRPQRILQLRISRGSTYAHLQGCPSELGCTIILRGANRATLVEVKRIISFSVVVAYHLRLEVAYYNDRSAQLPTEPDFNAYDDYSDDEDTNMNGSIGNGAANTEALDLSIAKSKASLYGIENVPSVVLDLMLSKNRHLLSTSLDVDVGLPYRGELRGVPMQSVLKTLMLKTTAQEHQTLLVTSLLMADSTNQRSKAEVKGIRFYTPQDIALGQFLMESCFSMHKYPGGASLMDHTLSFVHRTGRIDISVHRLGDSSTINTVDDGMSSIRDPTQLPILMSSYCKECDTVVSPEVVMSDETWKMSFGKFLEITFYNRSARGRTGGCNHCIRDHHVLFFTCEGYAARFDFTPIHPFAIHIRPSMEFPQEFHCVQARSFLNDIPIQFIALIDGFRRAIAQLEREVREVLAGRPEDISMVTADLLMIEDELQKAPIQFAEAIARTEDALATYLNSMGNSTANAKTLANSVTAVPVPTHGVGKVSANVVNVNADGEDGGGEAIAKDVTAATNPNDSDQPVTGTAILHSSEVDNVTTIGGDKSSSNIGKSPDEIENAVPLETAVVAEALPTSSLDPNNIIRPSISVSNAVPLSDGSDIPMRYPMYHKREAFLKAFSWNKRIDTIYRFLDSVRTALQQQSGGTGLLPSLTHLHTTFLGANMNEDMDEDNADYEDYDDTRKPPGHHDDESDPRRDITFSDRPTASKGDFSDEGTHDGLHTTSIDPHAPSQQSAPSLSTKARMESGLPSTSTTTATLASKALLEPEKDKKAVSDKVKASRITKAFARLVMGKDSTGGGSDRPKEVPLGVIGEGRLGLKPGKKGEVIAVHEDELATIIAHSLASQEYHDQLQTDDGGEFDFAGDGQFRADGEEAMLSSVQQLNKGKTSTTSPSPPYNVPSPAPTTATSMSSPSLASSSTSSSSSPVNSKSTGGSNSRPVSPSNVPTASKPGSDSDSSKAQAQAATSDRSDSNANNMLPSGRISPFRLASGPDMAPIDLDSTLQKSERHDSMSPTDYTFGTKLGEEEGEKSESKSHKEEAPSSSSFARSLASPASNQEHSHAGTDDLNVHEGADSASSGNNGDADAKKQHPAGYRGSTSYGSSTSSSTSSSSSSGAQALKAKMISQKKSQIRIQFADKGLRGNTICKFVCDIHWAAQFEALRAAFLKEEDNDGFIRSLSMTSRWLAQGGKSGATFSKTLDERFIVKVISRVELQMFLEFAPAYFDYMAKALFDNLYYTVLCKILGVYTIGYHNKETNKKALENVVVMENIFYQVCSYFLLPTSILPSLPLLC